MLGKGFGYKVGFRVVLHVPLHVTIARAAPAGNAVSSLGQCMRCGTRPIPSSHSQCYWHNMVLTVPNMGHSVVEVSTDLCAVLCCVCAVQVADCHCLLAGWWLHQVWPGQPHCLLNGEQQVPKDEVAQHSTSS